MSIQLAIKQVGSAELARHCGCTSQHIYNWRLRGIPADRVLSVSRATAWQVTPHQLRPDIYPNPTDGIPPEVAAQQKAAA